MSPLGPAEESVLPDATAQVYAQERDRVGHLPSHAETLGARPDVYGAWRQLVTAVAGAMPARRFELVALAAARELRSTYCAVAHGAVLADRFLSTDDVIALAGGAVPDALDDGERSVVAFAAKAARAAADITADDVGALRAHGLSDAEVLDVVLATAARCLFSTVLDVTGTRADAVYAERLGPDLCEALTVGRPIAQP